jgi:hypothetical protein
MGLFTQNIKPHAFHSGGESISNCIMGWSLFPTLGTKKKGGSLHDLKASHKCSESPRELENGGGPIWCAMQRKKYWRLDEKVEQLGEQKAKHPHPSPHKTSRMYNANRKSCQK